MCRANQFICHFLFLAYSLTGIAQTRTIENLKTNIQQAKTEKDRLENILALCEQGYSLHPDTLMSYAEKAHRKSIQQKNLAHEVKALYFISFALTNKGLIDSSLQVADQCLEIISARLKDPVLEANVLNQKGRCFMRKSQYKEAIDMGYHVISEAERSRDTLLQMKGKTLIGWAYLEMGQTKEALNWHLQALRTTNDTVLQEKYSILFANLALNYNGLGQADSGFYYITKAIYYSRKNENLFALSNSLAIQAQLFVRGGQAKLAENPLKEVVEIRKLIGDPFYIVSDMSQLGLYYANNGQPEKGIAICNEGIAIARTYKMDTKLFFLYTTLAANDKAAGNMAKYTEVLENIITLKDSVYQENSALALAEMKTQYDLEKKENTIIRQNMSLIKKNYFLFGSLLLLGIVLASAFIIFRGYRRRQQLKMKYLLEEEKLISAQAVNKAEEKERRRIAADLHDNLGAYAASIVSNLDHISFKSSSQENSIAMQELRNNSQAMVAQLSDTIWAMKKDSLSLTAISDRIKAFMQRLQSSYPNIRMEVIEQIPKDLLLPPSQAFHLFKVMQEGINNALRHSHCRHIMVSIESGEQVKIRITDDGQGFSISAKNAEGNGIQNMRTRAQEAGWQVVWLLNEPSGTKVEITPTTN
jgi:signal transduction histidine kinase